MIVEVYVLVGSYTVLFQWVLLFLIGPYGLGGGGGGTAINGLLIVLYRVWADVNGMVFRQFSLGKGIEVRDFGSRVVSFSWKLIDRFKISV